MAAPDPSFWQDAAKFLWAALLIPIGIVYKKADNAVSREEMETHRKEDRENFRLLFQNAEEDRTIVREGFANLVKEMHAAENRLRDKIDAKPR